MKRFRTISLTFIAVIAVIFACNVYYLVSLYRSIQSTMEHDVLTSLAYADTDEMWLRIEVANRKERGPASRKGEIKASRTDSGYIATTTQHPDGTIDSNNVGFPNNGNLTDKFVNLINAQLHAILDGYIPVNLAAMDSIICLRLADRGIVPDFAVVDMVDSLGSIVVENSRKVPGKYDEFIGPVNLSTGLAYRVRLTPLTRPILTQMSGIIITVFLLLTAFTMAFWYLFNKVRQLRSIEEMKDDFVNNMTHELKTPIAIAYAANDAILNFNSSSDHARREHYLHIAQRQLTRLSELVENILSMSMERRKSMKLHREPINLRQMVDEVIAMQRLRKDKDIDIQIDIADDSMVKADRFHFTNILNNLIDNAIKYSGAKVLIHISGDSSSLSIRDNGIGIPANSISHIFEKFYRVPHGNVLDVRSYGIGLYYVRTIVDKMNWKIFVESHLGQGSVFTIKFTEDETQSSTCGR